MAIEVFNRYENKYMIDAKTFYRLQTELSNYMVLDAFNQNAKSYPITNIYYDTEDNHFIRTSLTKPSYKEKLRLRAYGTPKTDSQVYIEIKKKFRGLVNKRRSSLRFDEACEFIKTGIKPDMKPYMNRQVLCEIEYLLSQHELKPRLFISYNRRAYFDKLHDLRISFDNNILCRRTNLQLDSGIYGEQLIAADKLIMEIKVCKSIPVWLSHLLSDNQIYPVSFSKYGTEYQQTLALSSKYEINSFNSESPQRRVAI